MTLAHLSVYDIFDMGVSGKPLYKVGNKGGRSIASLGYGRRNSRCCTRAR